MVERARPTLVVFQGGAFDSDSPLERLVIDVQCAATLDIISKAAESGAFEQAVLVTEYTGLADLAEQRASHRQTLPLHVEVSPQAGFHFGTSLHTICSRLELERVVYAGGAAMPLATPSLLKDLAAAVGGEGECVTANNLFSADVVAFYPASALKRIVLPAADNDLAWLLHFKAGLPFAPMPRTLASQFDIDTPTDLATLWWASRSGPLSNVLGEDVERALDAITDVAPRLARATELVYEKMATLRAQVLFAGRVNSHVWRRLETNLPCQTRVISEERGMRASGREGRGEVVSILGLYADVAGTKGLVEAIERTCDAALIDSRVLFAHKGLRVSSADRFASDALQYEKISQQWVREFTEGVASARIPIMLGGHSLVAGGAWALSERIRGSASAAKG
jgi:CTP:molybdopterin cytidylyltransferase MocA